MAIDVAAASGQPGVRTFVLDQRELIKEIQRGQRFFKLSVFDFKIGKLCGDARAFYQFQGVAQGIHRLLVALKQ